ncbi:MAG: LuxR C-terminal-related transcriptional regulator [Paracoccus sp. (in: a-proteobacteria)]|uniref:LuxR C-terminal-related transcriptional regulator n=1 Tax=Paracoccus sp. TaxID=267 RepID=UPI0039E35FA5
MGDGTGEIEKLAFHHAPDATLVLSRRVVLRASARVYEVFGWRPEELCGQSVRVLYPGQSDYESIGRRAREALRARPICRDERFMLRKGGQVVWVEGSGHALDRSDPERMAIWTYRLQSSGMARGSGLTPAERRIAHYLVNGFTAKEMAQVLGCSFRTVEVHRANMIRKMNVRNSFELVRKLLSMPGGGSFHGPSSDGPSILAEAEGPDTHY